MHQAPFSNHYCCNIDKHVSEIHMGVIKTNITVDKKLDSNTLISNSYIELCSMTCNKVPIDEQWQYY